MLFLMQPIHQHHQYDVIQVTRNLQCFTKSIYAGPFTKEASLYFHRQSRLSKSAFLLIDSYTVQASRGWGNLEGE